MKGVTARQTEQMCKERDDEVVCIESEIKIVQRCINEFMVERERDHDGTRESGERDKSKWCKQRERKKGRR